MELRESEKSFGETKSSFRKIRMPNKAESLSQPRSEECNHDTTHCIHSPADVFPEWMLRREDFCNLDKLVRERRLLQALESMPYMRVADETKVLADYVTDTWPTAKALGPERVYQLARVVTYSTYMRGEYILEQGHESRCFYILVKGTVDVVRSSGGVVAKLRPGGCFGENAVSNGGITNASCIAHSESVGLLIITKTDYDNIMADSLAKEKADAIQILKRVPMFAGLGRSRIEFLARLVRRVRTQAGEEVVKQGDPPGNIFFISEGKVAITRNIPILTQNTWPSGPRSRRRIVRASHFHVKLIELERGAFFGERSVIESAPSAATITTLADSVFLSMDKIDFLSSLELFHKTDEVRCMVRSVYPTDVDILNRCHEGQNSAPKATKIAVPMKRFNTSFRCHLKPIMPSLEVQ